MKVCDLPGALPANARIVIMGYSGSGKSTLAEFLGERLSLPVLYLDKVHFLPGWEERADDEKLAIVAGFMDGHAESGWVIDGNYSDLMYERRLQEADMIVFMDFGRFACLARAYRRYRRFRNSARPSMADGCNEKFDKAFVRWILKDGRNKKRCRRFTDAVERYPEKSVVLKNQRQLDGFMKRFE